MSAIVIFLLSSASVSRADPSPMAGMPGLLDTHTVDSGRCVASFPSLSLDCGLTDRISVGAVGSLLLPNLSGVPSANLRLRFRLVETARLSSTLDLAAGTFGADPIKLGGGYVASNTTLRLGARHALNLTVAGLGLAITSDMPDAPDVAVGTLAVALTHEAAITSRLVTSLTVGAFPLVGHQSGDPDATFPIGHVLSDRTFVRGMLGWRFADRAALSAGVWWSPAFDAPLPTAALDVQL